MRAWQRDQQPEYTLTLLPTCPNDQDQLIPTTIKNVPGFVYMSSVI
jgi:hypothetical protein